MPSIVQSTILIVALLSLWPLFLFFRRWWIKPFQKPRRLLKQLQRSLRLTRAEIRHLNSLLGDKRDPITASQFLLDRSRWPIDQSAEPTKKLFAKLFPEH